eukprot:GHVL01017024.1.p1 GENE.GHVL01017024.1~~GHVL01017024.1.p1  ORF type:complete len:656 (+),score=123.76 GHVL01017024.1:101-2068(+)
MELHKNNPRGRPIRSDIKPSSSLPSGDVKHIRESGTHKLLARHESIQTPIRTTLSPPRVTPRLHVRGDEISSQRPISKGGESLPPSDRGKGIPRAMTPGGISRFGRRVEKSCVTDIPSSALIMKRISTSSSKENKNYHEAQESYQNIRHSPDYSRDQLKIHLTMRSPKGVITPPRDPPRDHVLSLSRGGVGQPSSTAVSYPRNTAVSYPSSTAVSLVDNVHSPPRSSSTGRQQYDDLMNYTQENIFSSSRVNKFDARYASPAAIADEYFKNKYKRSIRPREDMLRQSNDKYNETDNKYNKTVTNQQYNKTVTDNYKTVSVLQNERSVRLVQSNDDDRYILRFNLSNQEVVQEVVEENQEDPLRLAKEAYEDFHQRRLLRLSEIAFVRWCIYVEKQILERKVYCYIANKRLLNICKECLNRWKAAYSAEIYLIYKRYNFATKLFYFWLKCTNIQLRRREMVLRFDEMFKKHKMRQALKALCVWSESQQNLQFCLALKRHHLYMKTVIFSSWYSQTMLTAKYNKKLEIFQKNPNRIRKVRRKFFQAWTMWAIERQEKRYRALCVWNVKCQIFLHHCLLAWRGVTEGLQKVKKNADFMTVQYNQRFIGGIFNEWILVCIKMEKKRIKNREITEYYKIYRMQKYFHYWYEYEKKKKKNI